MRRRHVPSATKAIAELHRVLRPGGVAVVAVPDARRHAATQEATPGMSDAQRLERFGQVDHVRRFGRDFEALLAAPGFRVQRIQIGEWYKARPESRLFANHEYKRSNRFFYEELVFMAWKTAG